MGRLYPGSNIFPFYMPFWQKRYRFYIPSIEKRHPFHIPTLEHCTPFLSPCNKVIKYYQKKCSAHDKCYLFSSRYACQKIALTSETFAQIFLYLTAKRYKWTWFACYVEEKQHIIKVCSSENKHTNKTAPTCDPAEMWQQHRLLYHELHDSSVVSLPTVYYRSKSETYAAIESLDHKSCPKIVSEYLVVPCVHFATNGGTNESQSGHSEAKCQLEAVRSFWNPPLNTLEVIRRFTWTFCFQSLWAADLGRF